jgi:hypothetical protein
LFQIWGQTSLTMRTTTFLILCLTSFAAAAQSPPDPAPVMAAQREAMAALSSMDGIWRGPAWTLQPNGEKRHITQTERIGPFLQGTVKVIEGRGYLDDGGVGFNALGIVSYDPVKRAYNMRSYALGRAGDFNFKPKPDGYVWEIPAGPATIRYTATIKDNTLHEVGDRIVGDRPPVRFFEMTLKRVGETDWPAGNAVPPR